MKLIWGLLFVLGMILLWSLVGNMSSNENKKKMQNDRLYEENVELVGKVIDSIWALPWPEDEHSEDYVQYFLALKPEHRVIWATWLVQMWVDDWGFGQYFLHTKDDVLIEEAERGFREIGATELLEIFTSVTSYYKKNRSRLANVTKQSEYEKIMGIKTIEQELGNLLDLFYAKKQDFYRLRADYIRANQSVFNELLGQHE